MDRSDHDSVDMLKAGDEASASQAASETKVDEGQAPKAKPDPRAERAQRLAAALRQNLKRRKLPKVNVRPVDERN